MSVLDDPALSICFTVNIDGHELATFTGCSGLGAEMTVEPLEEGGNQQFIWKLPGRLQYTNIRLSRPLDANSAVIAAWFTSMATNPRSCTAEIAACRPDGTVVASWALHDVRPVRWTGPELSVDSPKVCIEVLELTHHGFLGWA